MHIEDAYMERTPDLVVMIRKMREATNKEMNRFTRVADYDVRRIVGQKPKDSPITSEDSVSVAAVSKPLKVSLRTNARQSAIEFPPASLPVPDDQEGA